MNLVFVSGMFRSGTTTLARALNAHPHIACASDPMNELLKAFRSEEAASIGQSVDVMSPLGDYYFDNQGLALLRHLLENSALNREVSVFEDNFMKSKLIKRCKAYSGKLVKHIDGLHGKTYKDYIDYMLSAIKEEYSSGNDFWIGFKEVWSAEFIPALARTYPEAKFITMTRDPRAVCASKKSQNEKYPFTFLCRQWRKIAALNYKFLNNIETKENVLSVRYEDFVSDPELVTSKICSFLEIPWSPEISDPLMYQDGDGNPWIQNTSHGKGVAGFDSSAIEKWKGVLTDDEVLLIETMCGPEMSLYNYDVESSISLEDLNYISMNPPLIDEHKKANWMQGVVASDYVSTVSLLSQEYLRFFTGQASEERKKKISNELILASYLTEDVYHDLYS